MVKKSSGGKIPGLISGTDLAPPRVILYGSPGVGKTTFAADAGAILIDCEGGAGVVKVERTPTLSTWPEIREWIGTLAEADDDRPVAIDTLDWMLRRLVEYVTIDLDGKNPDDVTNTIGSAHGGYYKARDIVGNIMFRELFPALNYIVESGRPVILLAHAASVKITTPEGYDLRMAAPEMDRVYLAPWVEWADAVLYASRNESGTRSVQPAMTPTVTAKNRYGIEEPFKLSWDEFINQIGGSK